MNSPITINLAVEDRLSEDVLRKLVVSSERPFAIGTCFRRGGFGYLKSRIAGFNAAAERIPFLVLTDPKQALISCARKSKRRSLREAIVPATGTTSKLGPDYNACLGRFVAEYWKPELAQAESESLERTIRCIGNLGSSVHQ